MTSFKIDFVDGIFACRLRFFYGQRSKCADLLNRYLLSYRFSAFTDTGKNPFKIDFVDGIFACRLRFSYGQRSKCADLLNNYQFILKHIRCQYNI